MRPHHPVLLVALAVAVACGKPADAPAHTEQAASAPSVVPSPSVAPTEAPDASLVTQVVDASPPPATPFEREKDAGPGMTPLPAEPWYHERAEVAEDCVPPLAVARSPHFPAPFDLCDPRAEVFSPTRSSAHFHYREFSVDHTVARRKTSPGECCYLIYEFPRRHH